MTSKEISKQKKSILQHSLSLPIQSSGSSSDDENSTETTTTTSNSVLLKLKRNKFKSMKFKSFQLIKQTTSQQQQKIISSNDEEEEKDKIMFDDELDKSNQIDNENLSFKSKTSSTSNYNLIIQSKIINI